MRGYNDKTVYDCFNNPFMDNFLRKYLNIPPMPIGNITCPNKTSHYTSEPLPAKIYVTSEKYVSTLTTPSNPPQFILINYDDTNTHHTIISYNHFCDRDKRV